MKTALYILGYSALVGFTVAGTVYQDSVFLNGTLFLVWMVFCLELLKLITAATLFIIIAMTGPPEAAMTVPVAGHRTWIVRLMLFTVGGLLALHGNILEGVIATIAVILNIVSFAILGVLTQKEGQP